MERYMGKLRCAMRVQGCVRPAATAALAGGHTRWLSSVLRAGGCGQGVRKIKSQHQRLQGRLQGLREVMEQYMGGLQCAVSGRVGGVCAQDQDAASAVAGAATRLAGSHGTLHGYAKKGCYGWLGGCVRCVRKV